MAAQFPDLRRGDTRRVKIQYPTGTDVTGWKFWFTMKASFEDTDENAILQVTTTAGDEDDDDPTAGTVYLPIDVDCAAGSYYWDIQTKTADGEIITILPSPARYAEKITVIPDVTQDTGEAAP